MTPDVKTLEALRIERGAPPKRRLSAKVVGILVFLVVVALGLIGWYSRPKVIAVRTVVVPEPTAGGEKTILNASGYVTARREATVSSKVTGKVMDVLVEEGMEVEAGQVLARIDSSNVEKSLQLAEAQCDSARKALDETVADLNQAEIDLRRTSALAAERVASQAELDQAQTAEKTLSARLERQKAEVAVAEREVAVWKQQLDDTIIRAPFAGIVTSKDAQPGEMISPMSAGGAFTRTGICTIVDMGSLEIEVDVSESYINRVNPGQPVVAILDSYPNRRIPAKVIAIIPTADRQKATVKVRVGFEQLDPRILPDMSVKAAFQTTGDSPSAPVGVTIPKVAIHQSEGHDIVWVVRDGRLERRVVTLGSTNDEEAIIAAGIHGGERIVVGGPEGLSEGDRVTEADQ